MDGLPSLGDQEGMMMMMEELGMQPGNGDVQRGRGDAPLTFGDQQNLKTKNLETIQGLTDMMRAAPGETLAIGETKHDDSQTPSVRQQGGQLSNSANGGDAVFRESLVPEEKALLKRYFK